MVKRNINEEWDNETELVAGSLLFPVSVLYSFVCEYFINEICSNKLEVNGDKN